ncbi:hypothetical protein AB1Y20_018539 [Prymnesium parvum]|uniref:Uncharacterized protein n=1 Tax=Prymnesium parvum TaxID=97485 RepID=A0AB34JRP8_PRYPA
MSQLDGDLSGDLNRVEWVDVESAASELGEASTLLGAVLRVERGGRLIASGTADAPVTLDFAGTGGGVIIMGRAPVAHDVPPPPLYPFGGEDWADSSGVLRYLRVWHSRRGIALFGVGNSTVVEHCEVAHSESNGFELHGGSVDVRHISAIFSNESAVTIGGGYVGRLQYVFAALGAHGRGGLHIVGNQTRPQVFSLTVLGGGGSGHANSTLGFLGGDGGTIGDAIFLHSPGFGVELTDAGARFAQPFPSPAPAPPPPSYRFDSALLFADQECGLQHPDGLSEGTGLGVHSSVESCALAAGEHHLVHGRCETFQFSSAYPIWGCICCHKADGGRHSLKWAVYQLVFAPPPFPSIPQRAPQLPGSPTGTSSPPSPIDVNGGIHTPHSSRGNIMSDVQTPLMALDDTALITSPAVPVLVSVNASCLSAECMLSSHFNPLPSIIGGACLHTAVDSATRHGELYEQTQCAGAFPSPRPADNWLFGWSMLFPFAAGTAVESAVELELVSAAQSTSIRLQTSAVRNVTQQLARRSRCSELPSFFDASLCPRTAFMGHREAFWVRLVPPVGELHISTCTIDGGFDTDLTVFELLDGCELRQVACNGDGFGEQGCQPRYSRLSLQSSGSTTYMVAVGGYGGHIGDNITLTATLIEPPVSPLPPPPAASPPPPLHDDDLQPLIDWAPHDVPFLLMLGPAVQLKGTLFIRKGKRVVLRGAAPHNRTVISIQAPVRHFEVQDGAELYLSNIEVVGGQARGGCGGAVQSLATGSWWCNIAPSLTTLPIAEVQSASRATVSWCWWRLIWRRPMSLSTDKLSSWAGRRENLASNCWACNSKAEAAMPSTLPVQEEPRAVLLNHNMNAFSSKLAMAIKLMLLALIALLPACTTLQLLPSVRHAPALRMQSLLLQKLMNSKRLRRMLSFL